jgi:hypothetical protein
VTRARFKVDEDLPAEIAELLRSAGHDAATVAEQRMLGWADNRLRDAIVAESRSLIAADVGFADARRVAAAPNVVTIPMRLPQESRRGYVRLASELMAGFPLTRIPGCVVTVTPEDVRVHNTRQVL